VGRRLGFGSADSARDVEVIGVVRDSKYNQPREDAPRMVYQPYPLDGSHLITAIVRTGMNPDTAIEQIRRQIRALDPALPVMRLTTVALQLEESLGRERLIAFLSSFFSLMALLLASIGLYGVMAYAVARRTSEIGIRIALGAERGSILSMVLRETLLLAVIGVAVGIPAALASSRLVSTMLYGLKSTDAVILVTASLVMFAVAAIAGYLPARRASRVDPMAALKYE
jgi:ABC-type antimicrobial peptide transport system permease subunit